jgi:hypothetical protein
MAYNSQLQRLRCFLCYVRYVHKSAKQLKLHLCNDTDLVLEYITFLKTMGI